MDILMALVFALLLSQVVQAGVLTWAVVMIRRHDQVLSGLPALLGARDQAMVEDFKKATFEAIDAALIAKADRKLKSDIDETAHQMARARRSTDVKDA